MATQGLSSQLTPHSNQGKSLQEELQECGYFGDNWGDSATPDISRLFREAVTTRMNAVANRWVLVGTLHHQNQLSPTNVKLVTGQHMGAIQALINTNALPSEEIEGAFELACRHGDEETVDLLKSHPQLSKQSYEKGLFEASAAVDKTKGHEAIVKLLVEKASPETRSNGFYRACASVRSDVGIGLLAEEAGVILTFLSRKDPQLDAREIAKGLDAIKHAKLHDLILGHLPPSMSAGLQLLTACQVGDLQEAQYALRNPHLRSEDVTVCLRETRASFAVELLKDNSPKMVSDAFYAACLNGNVELAKTLALHSRLSISDLSKGLQEIEKHPSGSQVRQALSYASRLLVGMYEIYQSGQLKYYSAGAVTLGLTLTYIYQKYRLILNVRQIVGNFIKMSRPRLAVSGQGRLELKAKQSS
jgi:hypothetical protein